MHNDIVPVDDRLPFDAERARAGDPVCTAQGQRVPDLAYEATSSAPFVFYSRALLETWTANGNVRQCHSDCLRDLRMIRQPAKEVPAPTRYDPALCEPFDRERAEKGDAVCDEAGKPVKVLHYSSAGRVVTIDADEYLHWMHPNCLRMAPRKTKRWWVVILFSDSGVPYWAGLKQTKEAAVSIAAEITTGRVVVSFTDIPE